MKQVQVTVLERVEIQQLLQGERITLQAKNGPIVLEAETGRNHVRVARRSRKVSAAFRRAVSERMKAYWAKRKAKGKGASRKKQRSNVSSRGA